VAEALAREYGPRAVAIHNGVDLRRFNPAEVAREQTRQVLGLRPGPVIGFVGRFTPQKDPLTFLRVVAALRPELPGLRALMVGDGPLRSEIEAEAARQGLEAVCCFTGPRRDIPEILGAIDLFLLSSVSEGFPFVVLEAMAMERPVVATAVNGVPELIEDGVSGLLVPRGDVAALTGAALELLRAPERARALGRAARQRVAERFTVARMVERTQALYLELAGG
jgi:glycosyltransferase involved in cell wall biosynthesis